MKMEIGFIKRVDIRNVQIAKMPTLCYIANKLLHLQNPSLIRLKIRGMT